MTIALHTDRTRALLTAGIVAGPLYMAAGLAQALTRDGFDLARHPFSLLALGDLGWIQVLNFLVTGVLIIVAAVAVRRVLGGGRGGTWGPALLLAFGVGVAAAGLLKADPVDGFPAGTPEGVGEISLHGVGHMASFGIGFSCLIAACFVIARGFAAQGRPRAARNSRIAGGVILAGVLGSFATAGSTAALVSLYVAVLTAWAWLSLTCAALAGTRTTVRTPTPATNHATNHATADISA